MQRGEFTKRAYLSGNMDLLEAEALNDLIHAETRGQQKQVQEEAGWAVGVGKTGALFSK